MSVLGHKISHQVEQIPWKCHWSHDPKPLIRRYQRSFGLQWRKGWISRPSFLLQKQRTCLPQVAATDGHGYDPPETRRKVLAALSREGKQRVSFKAQRQCQFAAAWGKEEEKSRFWREWHPKRSKRRHWAKLPFRRKENAEEDNAEPHFEDLTSHWVYTISISYQWFHF